MNCGKNHVQISRLGQKILNALFENSFEAVAILDKRFNFIWVNKVYADENNRTPEEYIGRNHFDLYPSDAKDIFEQVVATKKPVEIFSRPFCSPDNPKAGTTYPCSEWERSHKAIVD